MSREERWEHLKSEVGSRGLDLASQEARTLTAWVWNELSHAPPQDWEADLPRVIEHSLEVYRSFMEEFDACYLAQNGPGERWVRHYLRRHFGFAPPQVVEVVLERIRDRRFHLLRSFRSCHQPELFAPPSFERGRLRGYFRRVAWVESRHAPLDRVLRQINTVPEALDCWGWQALEDPAQGDGLAWRARLLADFWSNQRMPDKPSQPRFTRAMQLEGLVSLGLGFLTGDAEVERRCRDHLAAQLPAWERRRDVLVGQSHLLLTRLGEAEARFHLVWDPSEREALEKETVRLRGQLTRLRERIQRHADTLLPRPRHVRELLAGLVRETLSNVRFQRIGREVALLEHRVLSGEQELPEPPAELSALARRVRGHLAARPSSPRARGLSDAEREQRREERGCWLEEGLRLVQAAHALLGTHFPPWTSGSRGG